MSFLSDLIHIFSALERTAMLMKWITLEVSWKGFIIQLSREQMNLNIALWCETGIVRASCRVLFFSSNLPSGKLVWWQCTTHTAGSIYAQTAAKGLCKDSEGRGSNRGKSMENCEGGGGKVQNGREKNKRKNVLYLGRLPFSQNTTVVPGLANLHTRIGFSESESYRMDGSTGGIPIPHWHYCRSIPSSPVQKVYTGPCF